MPPPFAILRVNLAFPAFIQPCGCVCVCVCVKVCPQEPLNAPFLNRLFSSGFSRGKTKEISQTIRGEAISARTIRVKNQANATNKKTNRLKNPVMPLFSTGCSPVDFQEVKRLLRTKSGIRPIEVGKRPIKEGKPPTKAMVLVGISVDCLMSAWPPLLSLSVTTNNFWCKFWAVKNF